MANDKKDAAPAPAAKARYFRHNRRGAMRFLSVVNDPDDPTRNEYHRFTPVRVKFEDGSGDMVKGFIKVTGETLIDNKTTVAETLKKMTYVDEIDEKAYNKALGIEVKKA